MEDARQMDSIYLLFSADTVVAEEQTVSFIRS